MNKPRNNRQYELRSDYKDCRVGGNGGYKRWQPKIIRMVKRLARKDSRREGKKEIDSND